MAIALGAALVTEQSHEALGTPSESPGIAALGHPAEKSGVVVLLPGGASPVPDGTQRRRMKFRAAVTGVRYGNAVRPRDDARRGSRYATTRKAGSDASIMTGDLPGKLRCGRGKAVAGQWQELNAKIAMLMGGTGVLGKLGRTTRGANRDGLLQDSGSQRAGDRAAVDGLSPAAVEWDLLQPGSRVELHRPGDDESSARLTGTVTVKEEGRIIVRWVLHCDCGNMLLDDSEFCRKCGNPRTEIAMKQGVQMEQVVPRDWWEGAAQPAVIWSEDEDDMCFTPSLASYRTIGKQGCTVQQISREWQNSRAEKRVNRTLSGLVVCHLIIIVAQGNWENAGTMTPGDRHSLECVISALSVIELVMQHRWYGLRLWSMCSYDPLWRDTPLLMSPLARSYVAEMLVFVLHSPPYLSRVWGDAYKLNIFGFLRVYQLIRGVRTYSFVTTQGGQVVSSIAKIATGAVFQAKMYAAYHPAVFLTLIGLLGWMLLSVSMMIAETATFWDATWLTFITMTTVGYGDMYATTTAGKLVTLVTTLFGLVISALLISIVQIAVSLTPAQSRVAAFMHRADQHRKLERLAAAIMVQGVRTMIARKHGAPEVCLYYGTIRLRRICGEFRAARRDFNRMVASVHAGETHHDKRLDTVVRRAVTAALAQHARAQQAGCMSPARLSASRGGLSPIADSQPPSEPPVQPDAPSPPAAGPAGVPPVPPVPPTQSSRTVPMSMGTVTMGMSMGKAGDSAQLISCVSESTQPARQTSAGRPDAAGAGGETGGQKVFCGSVRLGPVSPESPRSPGREAPAAGTGGWAPRSPRSPRAEPSALRRIDALQRSVEHIAAELQLLRDDVAAADQRGREGPRRQPSRRHSSVAAASLNGPPQPAAQLPNAPHAIR